MNLDDVDEARNGSSGSHLARCQRLRQSWLCWDCSDSRIARSAVISVMRILASAFVLLVLAPLRATEPSATAVRLKADTSTNRRRQQPTFSPCGPDGTTHVRTTLYFGLTRPTGRVSEDEWRTFLRQQVTPRFPDGLTVWEAQGQWRRSDGRVARERSKVLLLVHDDTVLARATLGELVTAYKQRFEQESVLWESSSVCATT